DPLGFAAGDSNLYRDEANAPTNSIDPSGLDTLWVIDGNLWGPVYLFSGEFWTEDLPEAIVSHWTEGRLRKPIHQNYNPDSDIRPELKWGDAIDSNNFEWYDDTRVDALKFGAGAGIMIGSTLLPGPEDAVMAAIFSKYGIRIVARGGKNVLEKVVGNE